MSVKEETIVESTENDSEVGFAEQRGVPVRSTVARKCREFYLRRLERTETLQRRWSLCAPAPIVNTTAINAKSSLKKDCKVDDVRGEDSSSGVESEGSCGEGLPGGRRGEMVNLVKRADSGASDSSTGTTNSDRDDCEQIAREELDNRSSNSADSDEINSRVVVVVGGVPCDKSTSERTGNQSALPPPFPPPPPPSSPPSSPPLRKWNSTFDLAMDNLRREITSLIAQDNDLFRQLLSLNDSISELRDQQKRNLELSRQMAEDDDDDDDEIDDEVDFDESRHYSLSDKESLESLSDQDTSATTPSPASTLSSSCSSHYAPNLVGKGKANGGCGSKTLNSKRPSLPSSMMRKASGSFHHHHHHHHHRHHCNNGDAANRPMCSKSNLCLRCHSSSGKMAMPLLRRRAHSQASLHWKRDDFDSYDSGIHLQGAHSDSDHEIFV